jgi:hypothetical protein
MVQLVLETHTTSSNLEKKERAVVQLLGKIEQLDRKSLVQLPAFDTFNVAFPRDYAYNPSTKPDRDVGEI